MDYENINPIMIGKALRELRGTRTLENVAEAIDVSTSALAMYETGQRIPRDEIKIRIAKYYGVPVEPIFYPQKSHVSCG
jgi:transcriptional regulator with XRE-family HTH domain